MKNCIDCGNPTDKAPQAKRCDSCRRAKWRGSRKWNIENPVKLREAARKYRETHPDRIKASNDARKRQKKEWKLRGLYGITSEIVDAIFTRQHGRCAGCLRYLEACKKGANVDHCHTMNRVRGLLCPQCNMALGLVSDEQQTLRRLMAYLERNPAIQGHFMILIVMEETRECM